MARDLRRSGNIIPSLVFPMTRAASAPPKVTPKPSPKTSPKPAAKLEPVADPEAAAAFSSFCTLLDATAINARQPLGPSAIYTSWVVIWLLVFQRIHGNTSLQNAVTELHRSVESLPSNKRTRDGTVSYNTSSYSRARTRLKTEVTEFVADHVFDTLAAASPTSFGKRRVFIMDGTTVTLPNAPELTKAFPPAVSPKNQSVWPVCSLVLANELASGCAIRPESGAMYGENRVSELELAIRLLPRIPAKSLLMADRNFGVFAFTFHAKEAGHDVLTRLTRPRFQAWVKNAKRVRPGLWKKVWTPSANDRKTHPDLPTDAKVTVWLREVIVSETLTLLFSSTMAGPNAPLAELYRRRVDIETDIRDLKKTLKMDELECRTVAMVEKEIAMGMVAYNLVMQVRRLAATRAKVKPRRLSFTAVLVLVKVLLLGDNGWSLEEWQGNFERVLKLAGTAKIPDRPGRSYPRARHKRGSKYPNRSASPAASKPDPVATK